MSTWWPARRALGGTAVLVAVLTALPLARLGGTLDHLFAAEGYVLLTVLALLFPAAVAVQVVLGLGLVGAILVAPGGPAPLLLAPAVAGIIVSSELLAAVARMDTPMSAGPGDTPARAGRSALVGALVFGAVIFLAGLSGPTGLPAVVLATVASVLLAVQFTTLLRM